MLYHSEVDARPRLLILTASAHQIPLLERARALGFATVVCDRDPSAPGRAYADSAWCVDVTDGPAVLEIARAHHVCGVLAEQTDVAVMTGAFVASELKLPGLSLKAALRATNKCSMRDACRANSVTMPAYRFVTSYAEAARATANLGFPVIVKPVDSQASRGVCKVYAAETLKAAYNRAVSHSRSGGVLVERLLAGVEGSIESIVTGGRITVLGFCSKRKCNPPFSYDLELQYPGDFSRAMLASIEALNAKAIEAVGITDGLAHVEFILSGEEAALIEIAARGCGARVATDLLPALTGIDVLELRIRQAVGDDVTIPQPERLRHGLLRFMEFPAGRIVRITGCGAARLLPNVLLVHLARTQGDMLEAAEDGDGRPGFVLTIGTSRLEAASAMNRAFNTLVVEVAPAVLAV